MFMSRSRKSRGQAGATAQLILVRGQAKPSSIGLSRRVTRIGRSPKGNDVVVNDPPVSGQHAEIRSKEGRHAVRDLNSTNGTFVNGQRLAQLRPLRDGDRITMGNTEWQYRRGSGTESLSRG
jgi:pSer/pThr/pTyr-binding forkhead associated (FHA) protein